MNREIKFRLHDKEGNIIGYEVHKLNEYGCWQIFHTSLRGDFTDGNDERNIREGCFIAATYKAQYTGLKDKNGKEIYEGDILNIKFGMSKNSGTGNRFEHNNVKVEWDEDRWVVIGDVVFESVSLCGYANPEYEVIGNIYENPELLS